jgi:two-component system, chemotaxis family, response regulator Rcp1
LNKKDIRILIIDDSPSDAELAVQAFRQSKMSNEITVVTDGKEALSYLLKKGKYADAVRPDLILLDLNLPKVDGYSVLKEIKQDESLKSIPVVILTTSEDEKDVQAAYRLQASAFITKPVDFVKFVSVAKDIQQFYFVLATLPVTGR